MLNDAACAPRRTPMALALGGAWLLVALAGAAHAQSPYTNTDEFLHPDEAFQLEVRESANGEGGHEAAWLIAPGYYLYRDKVTVRAGGTTLALDAPPGETITDEFYGTTDVFRHHVRIGFSAPVAEVDITYQGCADAGLCYSPVTKSMTLAGLPAAAGAGGEPPGGMPRQSDQDKVFSMLQDGTVLLTLLSFLLFGVALAFTPCVLPVLPILFRTLTRTESSSALRAAGLSGVYVLAFSLVYAVLGVVSGLLGESVQTWLQKPWLIVTFSVLFVLLGLSMFGVFRLQMPAAIQTRLNTAATQSQSRGGWAGSAGMGAFSALVVGPCVTPALIGALLFIAQTRDAALGGAALFLLGLGMGLPLILLGTFFSRHLPKPGAVRDTVNMIVGFLMFGVAIWILDRLVSPATTLLLGGVWLVLAGVALFSRVRPSADAEEGVGRGLMRGCCAMLVLYGAILVVGAAMGGHSLFRPLAPLATASLAAPAAESGLEGFVAVEDLPSMSAAVDAAGREGRWTMVDFYADWCISCKELEAFTFTDARVRERFAGMQLLRFDVTRDNETNKGLLKHFDLFGPPALLFFAPDGEEARAARIVGFVDADDFIAHLERLTRART